MSTATNETPKRDNSDRKQIRFGKLLDEIKKVDEGNLSAWVKEACKQRLEREYDVIVDDNETAQN